MVDSNKLLFRQVHPSWVQGEIISQQVFSISSQTFIPTKKDEGFLSVYNSDFFTAESSYVHYTGNNLESSGVVAVDTDECASQNLPVIDDNTPFIGHSSLDYREKGTNQRDKTAKMLKSYAIKRGWQYLPEKKQEL